ncbi:MAG: arginine-tRNA-protein transferase [Bacteroidota bacterium]
MFTKKLYPAEISGKELDQYLHRAWYRMGQSIFTCHFLCFGERLYSALWLQLDLKQHQMKKHQRKLLRKNERFRTIIRPFRIDQQKEDLYQKYRWYAFNGNLSVSLRDSLLDGKYSNIYETMECCVYDDEQLVAASFFDIGEKSIASILGIYDPDYKDFSLGYYSMVREIKYGIEHGFDYYYPGYVVPNYPRFDYKSRIGDVSYYNVGQQEWLPFNTIVETDYPLNKIAARLEELRLALEQYQIKSNLYYYPLFETHLFTFWDTSYLKYPVFLWFNTYDGQASHLIVTYDLVKKTYVLIQCMLTGKMPTFLEELFGEDNDGQTAFLEVLTIENMALADYDALTLAEALQQVNRLRRRK